MSIRIKTEKVVLGSGLEARKVVSVQALAERDLPEIYIKVAPNCYLCGENQKSLRVDCDGDVSRVYEDSVYREELFQMLLENIRKCGEHLASVNKVLAGKREQWNGEETFVI